MANINPVSLPSAAGINYGEGDVRHFSEGDGLGVPAVSNPTRQLAQRDTLIAEKLNETITEVNNKEQIVPLPVYRTSMPGTSEEIIANFKIPAGYEARVLNAVISSSPVSSDIELNVLWAQGFGNVTGSSVITTTSESTGGTKFSPTGEFIVEIKNKGDTTLEVVASVTLTMRPVSAVSSALLPAPSQAPAGPPGPPGGKGEKGNIGGIGPAGSPGLSYQGRWARTPYPQTYNANDVVVHDFAGTSQSSSFVCLLTHIADDVNQPQPTLTPTAHWDFVAEAGDTGATGSTGQTGTSGVTFIQTAIQGTMWTSSDFVADTYNSGHGAQYGTYTSHPLQAGRRYLIQMTEKAMISPNSPRGQSALTYTTKACFTGTLGFILPNEERNSAATDYDINNILVDVAVHGTFAGTTVVYRTGPEATPTGWNIVVLGEPAAMVINVQGVQTVY
jgi:hypothetical protein